MNTESLGLGFFKHIGKHLLRNDTLLIMVNLFAWQSQGQCIRLVLASLLQKLFSNIVYCSPPGLGIVDFCTPIKFQ